MKCMPLPVVVHSENVLPPFPDARGDSVVPRVGWCASLNYTLHKGSISFSIKPVISVCSDTDHDLIFTPYLHCWVSVISYPTELFMLTPWNMLLIRLSSTFGVHMRDVRVPPRAFELSGFCWRSPACWSGFEPVPRVLGHLTDQRGKKLEGSLTDLRSRHGSEAAGSVASLIKAVPLMQSLIPINHRPCLEQLVKLLALRSWLRAWKWDERCCIIYEARARKAPQTGLWLTLFSWPSQRFSSSTPLPPLEFEPL